MESLAIEKIRSLNIKGSFERFEACNNLNFTYEALIFKFTFTFKMCLKFKISA